MMGTTNATIKFTDAQFEEMIGLAKAAIKEHKQLDGEEGSAIEALEKFADDIEKAQNQNQYALVNALINYFDSPRRPSTIANALKKKGVWSGEWEEGSHAFAITKKKAVDAVKAIELKHYSDEEF